MIDEPEGGGKQERSMCAYRKVPSDYMLEAVLTIRSLQQTREGMKGERE